MVEVVFTLKPIVEPRLTLMSVANPWIDALPEPEICHSLLGVPGFVFSQAISLTTGASQGAAAAFVAGSATSRTMPKESANAALSSRRENSALLNEARESTPRHRPSGRAATRLQRGYVLCFAPRHAADQITTRTAPAVAS